MPDRSFMECWSLDFDDAGFVEGFNLDSRIWVAFQLRFFRTHGRFPSREDDPCRDGLQYLGQQLDVTVPDAGQFRFRHVNARRHRVCRRRHKRAGLWRFAALLKESFSFPLYGSHRLSVRRESVVARPLPSVPAGVSHPVPPRRTLRA